MPGYYIHRRRAACGRAVLRCDSLNLVRPARIPWFDRVHHRRRSVGRSRCDHDTRSALLLYAANQAAPEHARALEWLDARLNAAPRVGLPWPSLLAFVRLATNPVVVRQPTSLAD